LTRSKEIVEELRSVISGKTLDAVLPPLLFVVLNGRVGLGAAIVISALSAIAVGVLRVLYKQKWQYAFGGLAGIIVASGFSYFSGSAANYFLPGIISSGLVFLLSIMSVLVGKPLAAWASHLSRGWTLDWFWRSDVKPAYREVTLLWSLFFLLRFVVLMVLLSRENVTELFAWKTLLGWPVTIGVLVISYIYGIWRLKNLGGPGIEEHLAGKQPPYKGQTRGF
jgi:hypothetical protein